MFKSKKKKEEQETEAFFAEYRELAHRHKRDFSAALKVTKKGIVAVIEVVKLTDEAGSK